MVIPPLIGNPYNAWVYKPLLLGWVSHPLLYGNNGTLDPSTCETLTKLVGNFHAPISPPSLEKWPISNQFFPNRTPEPISLNSNHGKGISYKDHQKNQIALDDLTFCKLHLFFFDSTKSLDQKISLRLWIPAILIFDFMTPQKKRRTARVFAAGTPDCNSWRLTAIVFKWAGKEINKIFGVWGHYTYFRWCTLHDFSHLDL